MTWWEWGLLLLRLYEEQRKQTEQNELYLSVKRIEIANFLNANRDKNSPVIVPEQIFKLSYDTQLKPEADPELFARVAKRLGRTIKRKKGDE